MCVCTKSRAKYRSFLTCAAICFYMNGNHAASMFLDAFVKGQRGFDLAKAYEGLRKVQSTKTVLPDTRGPATKLIVFTTSTGFTLA